MKSNKRVILMVALLLTLIVGGMSMAQEDNLSSNTSSTTVHRFADTSVIADAWSTMTRNEAGVIATFHTSELTPDDVVTMWWVIFNEPQNCSDACGEDDIFLLDENGDNVMGENGPELNWDQIETAQIALVGATGIVVNTDGTGHFSAVLSVGDNPNTVFGPSQIDPSAAEFQLAHIGATGVVVNTDSTGHLSELLSVGDNPNTVFGPSLTDPNTAEIHLVLRTHGTLNEEALAEQIILFNGGCAAEYPNEPCQDVQFAVHQAE